MGLRERSRWVGRRMGMRMRMVGLRFKGMGKVVSRKELVDVGVGDGVEGEGEVCRVLEGDAGWEKEAEVEFERYVEGLREKYQAPDISALLQG